MRINNIKPETEETHLQQEIYVAFRDVFETQMFWNGKTLSITFRLKELKPQDTNFRLSKNWNVTETEGFYPNSQQKRLIAVNVHFGTEHPIKRGYALQEPDWILVNQTLNRICDELGISATIRSSLIKIRDGKQNVWLSNYLETIKDVVEAKGDYAYSDSLEKAIEDAKPEDKYKFESVFLTEPLEVTEETRITQKVFTDYDELDALAKANGYQSPTPEQNVNESRCGWIATMGDESHNPISMLREAMQKLRDAQKKHGDAIMGFCQTGNFSISYTIYIKK
jgi:hypothetical protein